MPQEKNVLADHSQALIADINTLSISDTIKRTAYIIISLRIKKKGAGAVMKIYVAGYVTGSMVDGPGMRTVIFLSGCDIKCHNCHNQKYWNKEAGMLLNIDNISEYIRAITPQKKVTISGGEPLMQIAGVRSLLNSLMDFDIGIYTGHSFDNVPGEVRERVRFVKVGKYVEEKKVTGRYFGSWNQEMILLGKDDEYVRL